jgi:hypothetical protein
LFAPTARAFADVPTAIVEQLFMTATSFPSSRSSIFAPSPRCILDSSLDACSVLVGFNGELLIDFPLFTVDLNNVVDGDNFVSNGVVHVIDGVLVPSWVFNSLTDRVFANDDLSTLFSLLVVKSIVWTFRTPVLADERCLRLARHCYY